MRKVLEEYDESQSKARTKQDIAKLWVQAGTEFLVIALGLHSRSWCNWSDSNCYSSCVHRGVEEHKLGHAFEEALQFTSLLVVFFAIVAVIHDQHLFSPVIQWVLTLEGTVRLALFTSLTVLSMMLMSSVLRST